jgi:hypothetical protein
MSTTITMSRLADDDRALRMRRVIHRVLFGMALTTAAAMLAAGSAGAREVPDNVSRSRIESTADGQLVDVEILVGGDAAPLYIKPGTWNRRYFEAFKGRNYALSVRNNTGRRVAVLIAVDGINVVNGDRSSLRSNEPMYVLDPWERTVIQGWRTSMQDVRRFVFVDEHRSYAERTGQANGDLGWIRVLSFREQQNVWGPPAYKDSRDREGRGDEPYAGRAGEEQERAAPNETRAQKPNATDKSNGSGLDANPGTGWGDPRHDPVQRTWFVPAGGPTDQLVFRYEYAAGLRALGIVPDRNRTWEREHGHYGFAQPPRW